MDDSLQDLLKKAWHGGRQGYLSPLSEARAWALREIWREEGKPEYGMLTYIAGKITKNGGGNPGQPAMSKFFAKVDADPEWFPGKVSGDVVLAGRWQERSPARHRGSFSPQSK